MTKAERDALVMSVVPWCWNQAKKYCGRLPRNVGSREDAFQEAMVYVLKAVEHFDSNRGVKFTTYAAQAATNAVIRYRRRCKLKKRLNWARNTRNATRCTARYGLAMVEQEGQPDRCVADDLALEDAEVMSVVREGIDQLHPRHADLMRRRLAGDQNREIARDRGVHPNNIRDQKKRALANLRRLVAHKIGEDQ